MALLDNPYPTLVINGAPLIFGTPTNSFIQSIAYGSSLGTVDYGNSFTLLKGSLYGQGSRTLQITAVASESTDGVNIMYDFIQPYLQAIYLEPLQLRCVWIGNDFIADYLALTGVSITEDSTQKTKTLVFSLSFPITELNTGSGIAIDQIEGG